MTLSSRSERRVLLAASRPIWGRRPQRRPGSLPWAHDQYADTASCRPTAKVTGQAKRITTAISAATARMNQSNMKPARRRPTLFERSPSAILPTCSSWPWGPDALCEPVGHPRVGSSPPLGILVACRSSSRRGKPHTQTAGHGTPVDARICGASTKEPAAKFAVSALSTYSKDYADSARFGSRRRSRTA